MTDEEKNFDDCEKIFRILGWSDLDIAKSRLRTLDADQKRLYERALFVECFSTDTGKIVLDILEGKLRDAYVRTLSTVDPYEAVADLLDDIIDLTN